MLLVCSDVGYWKDVVEICFLLEGDVVYFVVLCVSDDDKCCL